MTIERLSKLRLAANFVWEIGRIAVGAIGTIVVATILWCWIQDNCTIVWKDHEMQCIEEVRNGDDG